MHLQTIHRTFFSSREQGKGDLRPSSDEHELIDTYVEGGKGQNVGAFWRFRTQSVREAEIETMKQEAGGESKYRY